MTPCNRTGLPKYFCSAGRRRTDAALVNATPSSSCAKDRHGRKRKNVAKHPTESADENTCSRLKRCKLIRTGNQSAGHRGDYRKTAGSAASQNKTGELRKRGIKDPGLIFHAE